VIPGVARGGEIQLDGENHPWCSLPGIAAGEGVMPPPTKYIRSRRASEGRQDAPNQMGIAFSVGGVLQDVYVRAEGVSEDYKAVEFGKPLVIRYKSFFFRENMRQTGALNRLMISTMLKKDESQLPGAEAVNYLNTAKRNGDFFMDSFGGEDYGHPLIFYSPSYMGEVIRMTSKAMELDRMGDDIAKALKRAGDGAGGLPLFKSLAPYFAAASIGVEAFETVHNLINHDDPIFTGASIDLHFDEPNAQRLQSGRYVMVAGVSDADLVGGKYALSPNNRLQRSGAEVRDCSYFVFQVNQEQRDAYKKFDPYKGAAELLAQTNRSASWDDIGDAVVRTMAAANDIETIRKIGELDITADDEESRKQLAALRRRLSSDTARTLKTYLDGLTG
jgi:hypothetical protein